MNYEAEQAILGSILMDNNVANDFTSLLREKDFALSQHKIIFEAVYALNQANLPIDSLTVADKLSLTGKIDSVGGMEYIAKLVTSIPSTANAEQYFEIVKRDSLLRDIIEAGNKISKNGYLAEDADKALDFAERTVFEISEKHESSKLLPIVDASAAALGRIQEIQKGDYKDNGIRSGFGKLDGIIESMKPGALCILAARPSVGKTAFALSVAVNSAIQNEKKVAIFSLEMPAVQLVQRMLTTNSKVPYSMQNVMGRLDLKDTKKLFDAHKRLSESKIFVDDNSYNTPADIISKCRRMKNTEGLDLVIIDYLQLMELGEKKENRQQEVSSMSRMMKIFAKELNVPFLVLSQLSRGTEQRGDEPVLSDLRESGSIEQDADMVMFLHRPKKVEKPTSEESRFVAAYGEDRTLIKMLVAKNRNGKIGNCYFDWNGDLQTFTTIDIRELSDAPAVSINKEVTSLDSIKEESEKVYDDLKAVEDEGKGYVEEIADDAQTPIKEKPFDTTDSDNLVLTKNESGDQSFEDGDSGEIPY